MKFDVVRAWKDEAYRQTLSSEQLNSLPANPVGELSDAELTSVCGGYDGPGWGSDWGFGVVTTSSALVSTRRLHSWGLTCDIDVFSADVNVLGLDRLINIGSTETRFCVDAH